ncbi:MAG: IS4 family transposase [Anaerolineae bacterium]|nr:IS4 family transposase [Anaerolineae bacterium]
MTNLLFMMMGMFLSRSVHLDHMARKLPSRAKKASSVKRLGRFLDNPLVQVRAWYDPFARWVLLSAASGGGIHLIIDTTKVAFGFRLVMVSVAYRRRSLPIAWMWAVGTRGHTTTRVQLALLNHVRRLLPTGVAVSLVGDSEFGRPLLIEYLRHWGWDYALRQPGDHLVWCQGSGGWQRLDSLLPRPGCRWLGGVVLTQASAVPTHLALYWRAGEKLPWLLATNQTSILAAVRLYRRRMWIEEMFGDLKKHGFNLESSHLRSFLRLSRLTLVVCLLYIWLMAVGKSVERNRLIDLVDRHDRHDLSIFRWGWDFVERCLSLHDPLPSIHPSNFCLVSGG